LRHFAKLVLLPALAAACSGGTSSVLLGDGGGGDADRKAADTGAARHDSGVPSEDTGTTAKPDGGTGGGPLVYVRITAVGTAAGSGGSGASQETPTDQRVGIYGLTLLKDASDPSPLVVINSTTPLDTPYNAGSSTLLGHAPASALPAGNYTLARVPVGYVSFTVAGTYHASGATAYPGDITDVIALTTGVTLQGAVRDRGWWASSFAVSGNTVGATTGENADIAQPGSMSHIGLDLSGAVAAYLFPVNITIPPSITTDMEVVFTVNTYQDFHWMDESDPGYTAGVFDVSPGSFETVTQLGANSYTVSFGPVTTP
jgi:hypothetical protein